MIFYATIDDETDDQSKFIHQAHREPNLRYIPKHHQILIKDRNHDMNSPRDEYVNYDNQNFEDLIRERQCVYFNTKSLIHIDREEMKFIKKRRNYKNRMI